MTILTNVEALTKRNQLVELGYTMVPGVMPEPLLAELRSWSDDIFRRMMVDPELRYQGSDFDAWTEWRWADPHRPITKRDFLDPMAEKFINQPAQQEICHQMGLEELKPSGLVTVVSKPGYSPPLYWHQDYMNWNSPAAATPWPTRVSLAYYLTDTTRENGCLRVIPGSHRKRHELHDILPTAHQADIQAIDDLTHPAFAAYPEAMDVPVKAGDLVIADARLLHATWPNQTDQRRTLLLAWHDVFSFPRPPGWWTDDIPEVIKNADSNAQYEKSLTPSHYLE